MLLRELMLRFSALAAEKEVAVESLRVAQLKLDDTNAKVEATVKVGLSLLSDEVFIIILKKRFRIETTLLIVCLLRKTRCQFVARHSKKQRPTSVLQTRS